MSRSVRTAAGLWLGLAAAAMLGGCNIVVSPTPVFTAADSAGAPELRPGLWATPRPGCSFDDSKPSARWPDCVDAFAVDGGMLRDVGDKAKGKPGTPYVIAAGDPLVLQARSDADVQASAGASASGGGAASASASAAITRSDPPPYIFLAVHPLALDDRNRMIRIEAWPVLCGPPPPEPPPGTPSEKHASVTLHPFPGLTIQDQVCTPAGKAAVLGAAGASRAFSVGQIQTSHWVRDSGE